MYDMHYDLLTILYYNFKEGNPYSNIPKMLKECQQIYRPDNIIGGIINLYFMSPNEMLSELGISLEELKDVKKMFRKSIEYVNILKQNGIIPCHTDFLYSIEGCDYLKDEYDLDVLYEMGLDSILPVWNEKNKFGSGNRSKEGLTTLGKRLIKRAIDLGIIIDVSHANKKTFYDILEIIEQEQSRSKEVIVTATHSNVRTLCNKDRNLEDMELIRLRDIGGYIGLFTNSKFLKENYQELNYKEKQNIFLKHLTYLIYEIKFPIERIIVSTDDMNFHPDSKYHHYETFPIETIANDIYHLISSHFSKKIANAILITNPSNMIHKVRQKREKYIEKISKDK